MGDGLHPLIISYFEERMRKHGIVKKFSALPHSSEIVYVITRKKGLGDVVVHLSDAYFYSEVDYASRPSELNRGGFILIARPEANFDERLISVSKSEHLNIGNINKLMGALHRQDVWKYETPPKK